jgi:hypothetical protein
MTWIDDEVWREPGEGGLDAGPTLYWFAVIIAALIVVFALADLAISWAQGQPVVRVVAFMAAVAVWLVGRICRAVLP